MNVQNGSFVAVNLAPFIGSAVRSRQSVPCRVLEVQAGRFRVCTEEPYRRVSLWIQASWIDKVLEPEHGECTSAALIDAPPAQSLAAREVATRPKACRLVPAGS
jgi:hypothetical protein